MDGDDKNRDGIDEERDGNDEERDNNKEEKDSDNEEKNVSSFDGETEAQGTQESSEILYKDRGIGRGRGRGSGRGRGRGRGSISRKMDVIGRGGDDYLIPTTNLSSTNSPSLGERNYINVDK